ncbi:MAG: inositol monophosphatase family protein [Candidatus Gottesmanbacteria bacterium]
MNESIDLTEARKFLVSLVPQAGKILKRYFSSGDFTQRNKGGVDFTTQVDEEVDSFLREQIKKQYFQTNFLTEETAPPDYSLLRDANDLWVIDPLDGTTNFSRKHSNYAISIGLVDKGVTKLGVVHIPMTGDTYWTQADKEGAFLNDEIIHVSTTNNLRESVVGCDWAWDIEKRLNVVRWLGNISTYVRQIKAMGSAVSDLASLADGRIDVYIHSGLKPWDVAAISLLIEKAGGKITSPTGLKWDVFQSDILATNGIFHDKIIDLLTNGSQQMHKS